MKPCLLASLALLFIASPLFAQQKGPKLKPLLFQADKNNIQVLPQRFEYSLISDDTLKVGNILIDTTKVTIHLEATPEKKDTYRLRFNWPAGLLKEGELAIKNNSGKAIFTAPIDRETTKVAPSKPRSEDDDTSIDIAEFTSENIAHSLIEDMKYLPFITFCIYRESKETRIYLCSQELYLTSQGNQLVIKQRSASTKEPLIEINGKVVGNQGMIYLNDGTENVSFKSQLQTGAFLEIETRMKSVDFKDVVASPDNKRIILTASGAEPVDEKKVKKLSDSDWQVDLPRSRPLIYLKGEGDIPMRQEFYIKGNLPNERDRPYLSARAATRSYSTELTFTGVSPDGVQAQVQPGSPASELVSLRKNQFSWTIRDLPSGKVSRHYLDIAAGKDIFVVGYDVYRGLPMSLGLGSRFYAPSGLPYATVDFLWWFENFLGLSSNATHFHWGMEIERDQLLAKKDGEMNADITTFELLWRASSGLYLQDSSWGLSLPVQLVQGEGSSATTFGFGGFLNTPGPHWAPKVMSWMEYKLQYFMGSSGDGFKIDSAYNLGAHAYWKLNPRWNLRYGLLFSNYKLDPPGTKEDLQIGLDAGFYFQF